MVLRYILNNMLREAAQGPLREALGRVTGQAATPVALPDRCDIVVAMALSIEAGGLVDRCDPIATLSAEGFTERFCRLGERVMDIVETGPGRERTTKALAEVIPLRQPQWVISAGFAGGLAAPLKRGHFLMADAVADESGKRVSIGLTMDKESLAQSRGVHVGTLLTVDRLLRDEAEKRSLGEKFNALACDMETMAVAEVCQREKLRLLSVRVISDAVDDELPPEIEKLLLQETTAAKLGAATLALWNRPSAAKDLWRLKEEAIASSDRLAKFLIGVCRQLPVETRELESLAEPPGSAVRASDVE